jgi:predicted AAA+ superfamily ATPase
MIERNNYIDRVIQQKLDRYIEGLPAFSLEGAKGVGKTTLAKQYAQTPYNMDSEVTASLIVGTPEIISQSAKPVLIDEWQAVPSIWNTVRHFIDNDMSAGQYILTGSAVPNKARLHSGAGRIVRVRVRPFSLIERRMSRQMLSLQSLLDGDVDIAPQIVDVPQQEYVKEIMRSGFPGIRMCAPDLQKDMLDGYLDNIFDRGVYDDNSIEIRRPEAMRSWLKSYAAAEGTTASYESIMGAATPGQDKKPSKPTTMVFREALEALWILDPVSPWLPEGNIVTNLGKTAKHYLADPALTARLLDIDEQHLLDGGEVHLIGSQRKTIVGRLFESLVAQSLKVYCSAIGADLRHMRSARGDHEVDFIVEKGARLVAIEAKFATAVSSGDVKQLNWLEQAVKDRKITKAIVYSGQHLVRRAADGVILIPAACLGV